MTRLIHSRKGVGTLLLTAVIGLGLAAGAIAYWTVTGSGVATTVLASPEQLTLSPGVPQAELSPGHDSSVSAIATNANPYFVQIGSLMLDTDAGTGGFEVDAGHSGCDLSVLDLVPEDNDGAGWKVPPKVASVEGTQAIELTDALSMDLNAASACQGATFTVHLKASA